MCGRRVAGNWNVLWKEKRDTTMVQRAFRRVFEELVKKKNVLWRRGDTNGLENVLRGVQTDTVRKPSCVLHKTLADVEFIILV